MFPDKISKLVEIILNYVPIKQIDENKKISLIEAICFNFPIDNLLKLNSSIGEKLFNEKRLSDLMNFTEIFSFYIINKIFQSRIQLEKLPFLIDSLILGLNSKFKDDSERILNDLQNTHSYVEVSRIVSRYSNSINSEKYKEWSRKTLEMKFSYLDNLEETTLPQTNIIKSESDQYDLPHFRERSSNNDSQQEIYSANAFVDKMNTCESTLIQPNPQVNSNPNIIEEDWVNIFMKEGDQIAKVKSEVEELKKKLAKSQMIIQQKESELQNEKDLNSQLLEENKKSQIREEEHSPPQIQMNDSRDVNHLNNFSFKNYFCSRIEFVPNSLK